MSTKKLLLITGASRGIGAATAKLAAQSGYRVCINYLHSLDKAQALANEIEALGAEAYLFQADVSDESAVINLFEQLDKLGRLSALVNNVGVLEPQCRLVDMDAARLNRVLEANVTSQFIVSREAIKRMSTKYGGQGGAIVNVSSAASRLGAPNEYIDYAASKGAVDSLTIGLAKEIAEEGIRVNCVRPAFIETDIHVNNGDPDRLKRVKTKIPLQRSGSALEVAQSIVWLLSDEASFVTGAFIDITGGA